MKIDMKQKYYYKVTTKDNKSCMENIRRLRIGIQYKKNKFIAPKLKGSMEMVFKTLALAERFAFLSHRIWKVEVKNLKKIHTACIVNHFLTNKRVKEFWKSGSAYTMATPPGTIGAEKVKLVKLVREAR